MNRKEIQTILEEKLPFDCSEYRLTDMEALLLGEDVYYKEEVLNALARKIVAQQESGRPYKLSYVFVSSIVSYVALRFVDGSIRTVDTLDSKLPWVMCEKQRF